jgi:hypothetical protein
MFNPKKESRNKNDNLPNHYVFLFFIVVLLKYHAAANFSTGCRESFENENGMAVVFGKCGCECLSGPGNSAVFSASCNLLS